MPSRQEALKGVAMISLAGILWGAMGTGVQYLFSRGGFTPVSLVEMRLLAAGLILVAVSTVLKPRAVWGVWKHPRDAAAIAVSGLLIFASHETFFEAIYWSNAGTAAIFLAVEPLLAGVWLSITAGRKMPLVEIFCFVIATAGVALIVTDGNLGVLKISPLALLWGMASAALGTAYAIQPRAVISRTGVLPVVSWGMVWGGAAATLFSQPWNAPVAWTPGTAAVFLFIVLFGTIAAFSLYLAGIRHVSAVIAGLVNCLEPLSAFLFSAVILGDLMGGWQALGVFLVLLNVVLVAVSRRRV